jgi:hypothetical protein
MRFARLQLGCPVRSDVYADAVPGFDQSFREKSLWRVRRHQLGASAASLFRIHNGASKPFNRNWKAKVTNVPKIGSAPDQDPDQIQIAWFRNRTRRSRQGPSGRRRPLQWQSSFPNDVAPAKLDLPGMAPQHFCGHYWNGLSRMHHKRTPYMKRAPISTP